MSDSAVNPRYSHYFSRHAGLITPAVVAMLAAVVVFIGWLRSGEEEITPDSGLGYWLGIVGGLMMVSLLYYSYRKRTKSRKAPGAVPTVFRLHMILGVLGPVLILFHCNFSLGALNSNVALATMLMVVASGVVGRYFYGKIHMGLYGRKAAAKEILQDLSELREKFSARSHIADPIFDELDDFGRQILAKNAANAVDSLLFGAKMVIRSRLLRARLRSQVRRLVAADSRRKSDSWLQRWRRAAEVDETVTVYFNALLKAAELRFYERLFGLWHVLHLPLLFVMVLAALVHVWAVHRY